MSYCTFCRTPECDPWNRRYHDTEYGFPLAEDAPLFERLILEINQAGLSWLTILKKKESFHKAYDGFQLEAVAAYGETERARLLADAGIIRNRLKVHAAIENARRLLALRDGFGSFTGWLDHHHPLELPQWQKVFKKTFVFTGGEIVREFLVSTGYLPGAHDEDCPVHHKILRQKPAWRRVKP